MQGARDGASERAGGAGHRDDAVRERAFAGHAATAARPASSFCFRET
jgi:hypothetical protein